MKKNKFPIPFMKFFVLLFFRLSIIDSEAAEPGKISRTAAITTVYRAIGYLDDDPKVRCNDPFAEKFFPRHTWDRIFPGAGFSTDAGKDVEKIKAETRHSYFYVIARTRHIDAVLSGSLHEGVRQVVILGSGYDSRAYRYHDAAPDVSYFEVDMPEMILRKKELVAKVIGRLPDWVSYVPVDFNRQVFGKELVKAGYDRNKKTLFLWEGVTMYITAGAVGSTLEFIAGNSAAGSSVVFDYIPMSSSDMEKALKQYNKRLKAWGEEIIFGIEGKRLEEFLGRSGLKLLSDLGPLELTNRYLIRSSCQVDGIIRGNTKIAHAMVPGGK